MRISFDLNENAHTRCHTEGLGQKWISQAASLRSRKDTNSNATMSPSSGSSTNNPIRDFLQASRPPMTHFMDAFIDFGCTNAEYLQVISSWPSEAVKHMLDKLPPTRDGRKMSEMDKIVLQNHFKDQCVGIRAGHCTVRRQVGPNCRSSC